MNRSSHDTDVSQNLRVGISPYDKTVMLSVGDFGWGSEAYECCHLDTTEIKLLIRKLKAIAKEIDKGIYNEI